MEIRPDSIKEDLVKLRLNMRPFEHHFLVVCDEICLLIFSLPPGFVLLGCSQPLVLVRAVEAEFGSFLLILQLLIDVCKDQHNVWLSNNITDIVILHQAFKVQEHLIIEHFVLIKEHGQGLILITAVDNCSPQLTVPVFCLEAFIDL
jgi:hypothetical protein